MAKTHTPPSRPFTPSPSSSTSATPPPPPVQPVPCCANCDAVRLDARRNMRCHATPPNMVTPNEDQSNWPRTEPSEWCRAHQFQKP